MAYESFPNSAHNSRAVTLAELEQLSVPLGTSGLVGYSGTVPVFGDSTGRQVKIRTGVSATIRGYRFNTTSETIVAIGANTSGQTRKDLLVLRLDRAASAPNAYTITPVVIAGTPATNPVAPQPVRDTPLTATGYYDLPLAEVTVVNAATTITAAQVANRAWWVAPAGYTGFDAAKPPPEPGAIFRGNDTGISYVGTSGGSWRAFDRDTGKVLLALNPGWAHSGSGVRARRVGQTVVLHVSVRRSGGAIGANTVATVAAVPLGLRPDGEPADGTYLANNPFRPGHMYVDPTNGAVVARPNNINPIGTDSFIVANLTYFTAAS